jgi:hypothetical protein
LVVAALAKVSCAFVDSPLLDAEREAGRLGSAICVGSFDDVEEGSLGEPRRRILKMECRFDCVWESGVFRASLDSERVKSADCVATIVESW